MKDLNWIKAEKEGFGWAGLFAGFWMIEGLDLHLFRVDCLVFIYWFVCCCGWFGFEFFSRFEVLRLGGWKVLLFGDGLLFGRVVRVALVSGHCRWWEGFGFW